MPRVVLANVALNVGVVPKAAELAVVVRPLVMQKSIHDVRLGALIFVNEARPDPDRTPTLALTPREGPARRRVQLIEGGPTCRRLRLLFLNRVAAARRFSFLIVLPPPAASLS